MKIGYFGTPEHSAKLLEALILEGHQILFVATNQ
ncbi:MAG TPA: methionyl-tRNA formyltransferase, partial [Leptospiraceae bacterium]|nr:methionyl-tRNA formyltransferase [Leptospiraceae bacterium]